MISITQTTRSWIGFVAASSLLCSATLAAPQQDPQDHKNHAQHVAKQEATAFEQLAAQLAELQAKVAQLELVLHQNHQGQSAMLADAGQMPGAAGMSMGSDPAMKSMGGMGMMKGMGKGGMAMGSTTPGSDPAMKGMGGMGMKKGMDMGSSNSMSTMQGGAGADTGMSMGAGSMKGVRMDEMKRMSMMGKMGRGSEPPRAAVISALPGFPGASHIYHIGASDHFLDYAEALMLTQDQLKQLARVHEESQLQQNDFERRIEQAEQELWVLTSVGEPDVDAVAKKVHEVGEAQADMRLGFIRSVGKAAKLLTDEQRLRLVGEYRADQVPSTGK